MSSRRRVARIGTLPAAWYRRYEHVHHSAAIEGNPITQEGARTLLSSDYPPQGARTSHILEVLGTDAAYMHALTASGYLRSDSGSLWAANLSSAPLPSLGLILDLHRRIMGGAVGGDMSVAGQWRTMQVYVANHRPPPPSDVSRLMHTMVEHWHSAAFGALHPLEQAALAHFELVWVHPFVDGNGRTARALSSYMLLRWGYPPLNLRLGDRSRYYEALSTSHPHSGGCTRKLVGLFESFVSELLSTFDGSDSAGAPAHAPSVARVEADGEAIGL